jgi:hypothetical protein
MADEERKPQTLRDAAENLLIAIGMGWDLDGCVENLRAALEQSDAEPVRVFAKAVLHGDGEHKAWLIEAAEAFIAGKPLPPPRGKGTKQSDAELPKDLYSGVFRGPDWPNGVFDPPPLPDASKPLDFEPSGLGNSTG